MTESIPTSGEDDLKRFCWTAEDLELMGLTSAGEDDTGETNDRDESENTLD